jgi:hypothetical protein
MAFFEYYHDGFGGWFRICGYGLSWKDRRKATILFSEQYGYRKVFYIGWLGIEFLKPWRRR